MYFKLDRLPEAMTDANRIVALQPDRALGYRLRAEAHDGLRERPQAVAAYRQMLLLDSNDETSKQRIRFLESEIRKETLLACWRYGRDGTALRESSTWNHRRWMAGSRAALSKRFGAIDPASCRRTRVYCPPKRISSRWQFSGHIRTTLFGYNR